MPRAHGNQRCTRPSHQRLYLSCPTLIAVCKQWSDERRGIAEFCHKLVGEPLHVTAEPCCYHDLVCVVRAVRFLDNLCQELPLGCLRSEEHTSELQSLMRISYAVFCFKKKKQARNKQNDTY